MTDRTPHPTPAVTPAPAPSGEQKPESHLLAFILAALAPLLTAGGVTDLPLARLAAQEAIAAYTARGQADLVGIAQILAFALAALDNLRLSMPTELSLSMKLKLRANALNRAARDATQTLGKMPRPAQSVPAQPLQANPPTQTAIARSKQPETPSQTFLIAQTQPTEQTQPRVQAQPKTTTKPTTPQPTATPSEHQDRLHWAKAMKTAAARLQAQAATSPPAQRTTDALWIQALTGVASDLILGKTPIPAPGSSKADLLRSTLMAANPDFPAHLVKQTRR
jgi:hypothetical protein